MRIVEQILLPTGVVLAATGLAHLAQRSRRRAARVGGSDFWLRAAWTSGLVLGLASLGSSWLEALAPALWKRGWHAHLDLVPGFLAPGLAYPLALGAPLGVWALVLRRRGPGGEALGQALGQVRWVQWALVPLVAAALFALPRLGGGPAAYPAFAWSTLVVVVVALVAAGRQESPASGLVLAGAPSAPPAELVAWPRALGERGFELEPLATWPASTASTATIQLELTAAIEALLAPAAAGGEHGRATLVFGAEDAGEFELVASAAAELAERYRRRTLVVVRDGARDLAGALARLLPGREDLVAVVERGGELPVDSPLWVAPAELCAERVLPALGSGPLGREIGLVVWWCLHRFSGVPAANLWALSHRLYRLLAHHGSGDLRTLALARRDRHAGAQVERYVRRLLPHPEASRREVRLEPRQVRSVELHRLGSAEAFFQIEPSLAATRLHRIVVAAKASVEAHWPTFLEVPESAAPALASPLALRTAGGRPLGERLSVRPAEARVRLVELADADVLALPEMTGELGRALPEPGPAHFGIVPGGNPYAEFLLRSWPQAGAAPTSRRLVAAVGQPKILHRHFLHALEELPGTGESLRRDFLAQEGVVQETLDQLHTENNLRRREVRHLGALGELQRDFEYRSLRPADRRDLPFDSAGGRLIDVLDSSAAHDHGGVLRRIDEERLLIEAYPHRIFHHGGQRYRVEEWRSPEEVRARGAVTCELEARPVRSVRSRRATLQAIKPLSGPVSLGRLSRQLADLLYEERVDGAVLLTRGAAGRETAETLRLARPLSLRIAARALLLLWPGQPSRLELASVAEALRAVLPVHLGVEDDDLEVVPLPANGEPGEPGKSPAGLAIVELYAGGFGLLEPIAEDGALQGELLARTRDWLARCPCRDAVGCPRCLHAPALAAAAPAGLVAQRSAALAALDQVLGPEPPQPGAGGGR